VPLGRQDSKAISTTPAEKPTGMKHLSVVTEKTRNGRFSNSCREDVANLRVCVCAYMSETRKEETLAPPDHVKRVKHVNVNER
jgi:hypothetical protein